MEMGLISPGGENQLDFLELRQVLSTYDGDLRNVVFLQNLNVEALIPNGMVFEGGTSEN